LNLAWPAEPLGRYALQPEVIGYFTQAAKQSFIAMVMTFAIVSFVTASKVIFESMHEHFAANHCGCATQSTHCIFPAVALHKAA
jgi:hypothetical protein